MSDTARAIGLDTRILQESGAGRGIATYIRGLLAGFEAAGLGDRVVRFRYATPEPRGPLPAEHRWRRMRRGWRETRGVADALNQIAMPLEVRASGVSLFHAPAPYDLAAWLPAPRVVTVHDVAPLGVDASVLRTGLEHRLMYRFARASAAIITVSEFSRGEIARHLEIPEERIAVIPEAPQPGLVAPADPAAGAALRARLGLPGRYLLHVGGYDRIEPRKDLGTLLDLFAELARRHADLSLVLCGGGGEGEGELARALAERGISERVRRTGFVPVEQVGAIYAGAAAFVFPSRYEGFGLPLLEAMAMGAPCVAARAASLPEVGGEAVRWIEPGDRPGWVEAVDGLLGSGDAARALAAAGAERARGFSWERAARATWAVYTGVLPELAVARDP